MCVVNEDNEKVMTADRFSMREYNVYFLMSFILNVIFEAC